MTDVVGALAAYLKADSGVAALAGTRVYGGELARNQIEQMPRTAVVLKPSGGGLLGRAYQEYGDRRIDIDCYGATPRDGETLYLAVYRSLKQLRRTVSSGVLLHWALASSAGVTARDTDTDWPLTLSSWQVLASEVPIEED